MKNELLCIIMFPILLLDLDWIEGLSEKAPGEKAAVCFVWS